MPLLKLLERLRTFEVGNFGLETIYKYTDDAGVVVNRAVMPLGSLGAGAKPLEAKLLTGGDEREQQAEILEVLGTKNRPVAYTVLAVQDPGEAAKDVDVLLYRPDGGEWAKGLVKPPTGGPNWEARIPWATGTKSTLSFKGLTGTLTQIPNKIGSGGAVVAVTDADIDTDGPGGSTAKDPDYGKDTSLTFPNGNSCDSRHFRGVVTPPPLRKAYGLRIGDLAVVSWKGRDFAAQIYDSGPPEKIGEISFGLAVDLGIYPDRSAATEARAATKGNDVKDLLTVFFPGSGDGKAMLPEAMEEACRRCLHQWLGEVPAAEKALFTNATSSWAGFFASLRLPAFFSAEEVMAKTDKSPNTPPPQELWQNIAPTLAVLAKIRQNFNAPLVFHSTYRSPAYNNTVGGVPRSQHLVFRAVDFHVEGVPPPAVADYARSLQGQTFSVALPGLKLTNGSVGGANPPPLNVAALNFRPGAGGGTDFTFRGGVQAYPTFVHVDCRGEDSSWG